MSACGAGTVASISSPGKGKAMPAIAIGDAQSDRVGDALDASPSRPFPSTPPDIHSPSLPTVCPRRCPARPTHVHPCQRQVSSPGPCAHRVPTTSERPSRMGRHPARASLLPHPDRLPGAPHGRHSSPSSTSSTVEAPPPPARLASTQSRPLQSTVLSANQRPPQRAGSSPCVPAVPGTSARSL